MKPSAPTGEGKSTPPSTWYPEESSTRDLPPNPVANNPEYQRIERPQLALCHATGRATAAAADPSTGSGCVFGERGWAAGRWGASDRCSPPYVNHIGRGELGLSTIRPVGRRRGGRSLDRLGMGGCGGPARRERGTGNRERGTGAGPGSWWNHRPHPATAGRHPPSRWHPEESSTRDLPPSPPANNPEYWRSERPQYALCLSTGRVTAVAADPSTGSGCAVEKGRWAAGKGRAGLGDRRLA